MALAAVPDRLRSASTQPSGVISEHAACVLLHPGTVDTPLSAPFSASVERERLLGAERAASYLLDIVAGLGPADSGRFIAWDGSDIPW